VANPPCNSLVATRLRSPNGSAGVGIASELVASVALDRSAPPHSVIRGHTGWARSSVMATKKKKGPKKKSKGY
jgi:hypothetical protein